jgi:hypothetical protein
MLDFQMERVYSQVLLGEKFLIKLLHKKYKLFLQYNLSLFLFQFQTSCFK